MKKLSATETDLRARSIYDSLYAKLSRTYNSSELVQEIAELRDIALTALKGKYNDKVKSNPRPVGIRVRVRKSSSKVRRRTRR